MLQLIRYVPLKTRAKLGGNIVIGTLLNKPDPKACINYRQQIVVKPTQSQNLIQVKREKKSKTIVEIQLITHQVVEAPQNHSDTESLM